MYGCYGNVCSVSHSLPGHNSEDQKAGCEDPDLGRDVQEWEVLDYVHSFPGRTGVSSACFIDYKLGAAVIATPYSLVNSTPFDKLFPQSEAARSVSLKPPPATVSGFRSPSKGL